MSDSLQSALSDMQGQLFEMSIEKGLDSETFIKAFMLSDIASDLDSEFNHMQWAGKEYIMERILDELKDKLKTGGEIYDRETMYWTGYVIADGIIIRVKAVKRFTSKRPQKRCG